MVLAGAGASRPSRRLALGFVVLGAGLRSWQYGADTSLWLDEVALAREILDRPLLELLTTPLDQAAPRGFLLIEKLAVMAWGGGDPVLRLLPLIGSLVALVAFWRLAERVLVGMGPAIATALFACAAPLIGYGAMVKQYSTDVAVAVLLVWLAVELHPLRPTPGRLAGAAAAGALAPWMSQPAVFVLAGVGAGLVWLRWRERRTAPPGPRVLVPLLAAWGLSSLAATAVNVAMVTPVTREYMHRFWVGGMMPGPLQALRTLWPANHLRWLIGGGGQASLFYPLPEVYLALMGLGLWLLWRRWRAAAVLVAAPIVVTAAAGLVRQYPFSDRLILFLVPGFLLGLAETVEWARRGVSRRRGLLGPAAAAALVAPALLPVAAHPPPYQLDDVKAALAHLRDARRPGDRVYVYYGAATAVAYYAGRYGLEPGAYAVGGCHRGHGRRYLEELDTFRGEPRVWIIIARAPGELRERDDIAHYLDAIGIRRQAFAAPARTMAPAPPVEVFLYDLSGPERLARASAAAFTVTSPAGRVEGWECGYGPVAMAKPTVR